MQNAAPVSGGMGMHLLRKMGWNPGEGLGKEKTGALEPLLLEVKLNKKGLVASEEQKRRGSQKTTKSAVKTLESKHPVSLLGEFTAKKKLGAPEYTLCLESGPDHKKMFLFKVCMQNCFLTYILINTFCRSVSTEWNVSPILLVQIKSRRKLMRQNCVYKD